MYCSQCRAENRPEAKFCSRCGATLAGAAPATPARPAAGIAGAPTYLPEREPARRTNRLSWILLGAGAFVVAGMICVVAGFWFLNRMGTTRTIGPQGGELTAAGGFKMIFPEGAFTKDMQVSVMQDPNPPAAPAGLVAAGPAYKLSLPPDIVLSVPVQVVLPFERQEGIAEDCYGAYLWDGKEWLFAGGEIEGDVIRANVFRFSTFQARACMVSEERPVAFINLSSQELNRRDPGVTPWTVTLTDPTCGGGIQRLFTAVNQCGGHFGQFCGTAQSYHWGNYRVWCFLWSEPDPAGSNLMVPFHMYLAALVTLDGNSTTRAEYHSHQRWPPEVFFRLPPRGAGLRGECGQDTGQPPLVGALPPPPGWVPGGGGQLSPASGSGSIQNTPTNTRPAPTPTPTSAGTVRPPMPTPTPTPTGTVRPSLQTPTPTVTVHAPTVTRTATRALATHTPTRTPTTAGNIQPYIVSQNHIHLIGTDSIELAHNGDSVVLKGPISLSLLMQHRQTEQDPWIPVVYKTQIRAGETGRFALEERTLIFPEDWDMIITLVSQ